MLTKTPARPSLPPKSGKGEKHKGQKVMGPGRDETPGSQTALSTGFTSENSFDVIVVGGGHAGTEAAVAAARRACARCSSPRTSRPSVRCPATRPLAESARDIWSRRSTRSPAHGPRRGPHRDPALALAREQGHGVAGDARADGSGALQVRRGDPGRARLRGDGVMSDLESSGVPVRARPPR